MYNKDMRELIGLKATINTANNVLYHKGTLGLITDVTVCAARFLTLEERAVFDRASNEYSTVEEYASSWILWSELDVKHMPVETFIVLDSNGKTAHFKEGEVYRSNDTTDRHIDLGIYRDSTAQDFHLLNVQTGLSIISGSDIVSLRCRIPTIANIVAKRVTDDTAQLEKEIDTLKNAHIIFDKNIPFYSL